MAASPMMAVGLRAMGASYAAMQAAGHNIANANVAGYSRQQAELVTAQGQYTSSGFIGKGVDVETVSRAHDEFLTRSAISAKSLSAMDAARQDRLTQLEQAFQTGEAGLGYTVSQFLNSMADLAARPGDSATRQTVIADAQDLAARFNDAALQLQTIQAGVTSDMKTSVAAVNGLAASIAKVNDQIAAVHGLGQPPNDLLDERDRLLGQLASYVQLTTISAEDGTVGVFVAGGQTLVLGTSAGSMKVMSDPDDASRAALALDSGGVTRPIDAGSLGGGSLAGLLRFQNDDLVDGRNLIGQMAAAIAGAVNGQQALGATLEPPIGTIAPKPVFAIGAPLALPAKTNARDASGQFVASVTLTTVDPSALQAADYELRADPGGAAGVYQLTRLSKPPLVRSVVSGDVVDGLRIDINDPSPSPTDRFLLQPVGAAASAMAALLQDPRELAAASPLIATAASTNIGTATVAGLKMNSVPAQPAASANITFTSDTGDYAWDLVDAGGAVLASGTGVWQANGTIPTAPADINGFSLKLAGVPRNGDSLTVAPTPAAFVSSNNGNAVALAALRETAFVGRTMLADGTTSGGANATDAYAAAIADIGVRVASGKTSVAASSALSAHADAARDSTAGVNLDEEAARLIQFQQSYQAAAKVLQIAQSLFDTLLQTTGR